MKYAISFNGGKESLVILYKHLDMIKDGKAIVFRVIEDNEFEEINSYVKEIEKLYSFKLYEFTDMKGAINILKEEHNIDIVILGVRRTDPRCENLDVYSFTDKDWPLILGLFDNRYLNSVQILRYSPLLDWQYCDVWDYIDLYNLPVCSLYTEGYTSLGIKTKTFPNFSLFNGSSFLHAKFLQEKSLEQGLSSSDLEREGRISHPLPVTFSGKVIHGKGLGKTLGFATANLSNEFKSNISLDEGVYCGTCIKRGKEEKMVMSIETNPTFGDSSYEVHILQTYQEDFYDEILYVTVTHFIRSMKKFLTLDDLINAISKDIQIASFLLSSKKN